MFSWYRCNREHKNTAAARAFSPFDGPSRPISAATVRTMKLAALGAVLATLFALPAAAQTAPTISPETRPLQANNAELPAACRDKPVPVRIEGQAYASDGDTITMAGLKPRIRIWGIQAAELRDKAGVETVPGMRARALAEDLLNRAGHKVVCQPAKWDRYCRYVALCEAMELRDQAGLHRTPQDIGARLLDAGLAYGFYLDDTFPGHPQLSNWYASFEVKARQERKGLWPAWLGEK